MASRDLTTAFLERRQAAIRKRTKGNDDLRSNASAPESYKKLTAGVHPNHDLLLSSAEEGGIQMSTFPNGNDGSNGSNNGHHSSLSASPPAWVEDVDAIESTLRQIRDEMDRLQAMHAQRLGSVFGRDLENMEGQIESLTQEITSSFRTAERYLQKVGMATKRAAGAGAGPEAATVGANIQRSLAKRLQELSVTFRQSQRKYLAEVQAQKSGGLVAGSSTDARFGIDLHQHAAEGEFFTTQQMAVVDDLTQAVRSRDQEIVKIAQSIEELGTIFKELAVLVIDQGTILDRIDYNMEAVVEHTKTGIQQLERAERTQKSARPLRCIMCLSSLIFILLFILILKHRPRHGWF